MRAIYRFFRASERYPWVMPHQFGFFNHRGYTFTQVRSFCEQEVVPWCEANFGLPNYRGRWSYGSNGFSFRQHADAVAFRLRWC